MRYVYIIRNLINDKVYVGQTKDHVSRKKGHWAGGRRGGKGHLYDSMRKHGLESFTFEVIEECDDHLIDDRERHWIAFYGSIDPTKGYNRESGGHAGKTLSEETKHKLSVANKGRPFSAERCKNIGDALRGRPCFKGRKENNPSKSRRISEALTGKPLSEEHKRATSEGLKRYMSQRGEWHPSEEARARMSESQKVVGIRRTQGALVDASDPDAQPKQCPVCQEFFNPKNLLKSNIKRHQKKRWCSRSCGRIGQNKFLSEETRLKIGLSRKGKRLSDEHKARIAIAVKLARAKQRDQSS